MAVAALEKLTEKQRTMITVGIILFFVLGGGGMVYYLQFMEMPERQVVLDKVIKDKTAMNEKINSLGKLKTELVDLRVQDLDRRQELPVVYGKFEDKREFDDFVEILERMRKESKMVNLARVFPLGPAKPVRVKGFKERAYPTNVHPIRYEIIGYGDYESIVRFIAMLETDKRVIVIDEFKIEPMKRSSRGTLKLQLAMESYAFFDLKQKDKPEDRKSSRAPRLIER